MYTISFNTREVERFLTLLRKRFPLTVRDVIAEQARLACLQLVKLTAPWAGHGNVGSPAKQIATGEGAAENDIRRIMGGVTQAEAATATLLRIGNRDYEVYRMVTKSGAVVGVDRELWRPYATAAELRAHHLRYRNRQGRVPKLDIGYNPTMRSSFIGGSGRWKFADRLLVPMHTLIAYIEDVKRRVGSLKAGWLPALDKWARISQGSNTVHPRIRAQAEHAGETTGDIGTDGNGSIGIWNTAHHNAAIREQTLTTVTRTRTADLDRWAAKRIEQLVRRLYPEARQGAVAA